MAKTNKANKANSTSYISVANLIAVVGLVFLAVFSFIGHSYKSGGEFGWDVISAFGITGLTAFVLWFLIKAKNAENRLEMWRIVEYVLLAAYVLIVIPVTIWGGIMHFFVVNDKKEEIKNLVSADFQKIDKLLTDYKEFESNAISNTTTGLKNASYRITTCDPSVKDFFQKKGISQTIEGVETYDKNMRRMLIGGDFEEFEKNYESTKNDAISAAKSWSVMRIPATAATIEEIAKQMEQELSSRSKSEDLPTIANMGGTYKKGDNQVKEFKVEGGVESFKFKKALQDADGFSATAILIVLLIHVLIILNYMVARRTHTVKVGKYRASDGGIRLDINN